MNYATEALLFSSSDRHVMEEFRLHLALANPLPRDESAQWRAAIPTPLGQLPGPFDVDAIVLCGGLEGDAFELDQSYALTG